MIRAYTGKTGSGKTYNMVKDAYTFWRHGVNIYSNTKLNFLERQIKANNKLTIWEKVNFWKTDRIRGKIFYFEHINEIIDIKEGVILFDEAQVLFNARQWESLPDEFQYKLQQHRKHKIDLLCTTQNMGTVDITYRRLVHSWYHCRNIFQLGGSPKIWFGWFKQEEKDVDYLYNTVDDLIVPTVKTHNFFIHLFSKALYDTMYDIGFKKLRLVCFSNPLTKKNQLIVMEKKASPQDALKLLSLSEQVLDQKIKRSTWKK